MSENIQKQLWKRLGGEDFHCQILKQALKLMRSRGQCCVRKTVTWEGYSSETEPRFQEIIREQMWHMSSQEKRIYCMNGSKITGYLLPS